MSFPRLKVFNRNYLFVLLMLGATSLQAEIVIESYGNAVRVPLQPVDIKSGDMDGNGLMDVITVNETGDSFTILFNSGSAGFLQRKDYRITGSSEPISLAVADFNGDGLTDVAVGILGEFNYNTFEFDQTGIMTYFNQSGGTFTMNNLYLMEGIPGYLLPFDYNDDGVMDIAIGNLGLFLPGENAVEMISPGIEYAVNQGDGTFSSPFIHYETVGSVSPFEFVDMDGDLDSDIVAVDQGYYNGFFGALADFNITIMDNIGDYELSLTRPINDPSSLPFSVVARDFDGDGDVDVIATLWGTDNPEQITPDFAGLAMWWNNGDNTFSSENFFEVLGVPSIVRASDFDSDGDYDLVITNEGTGMDDTDSFIDPVIQIFENDGAGNFTEIADLPIGLEPRAMVLGDWDNDGDDDIAVASAVDDSVYFFLNNTEVSVKNWTIY